jgi:hypothetical protein
MYMHTYSKIPLIQITWDQTCARVVDIQEIPTMVDVQILLKAFFNMSTGSVYFYDEAY